MMESDESCLTNLFHGGDDFFGAWEDSVLKAFVVGHRHVFLRDTHDRRVECVENLPLNSVGDFRAYPAERTILFRNHDAMRFRDGLKNRQPIERLDRTQIDHFGVDFFLR